MYDEAVAVLSKSGLVRKADAVTLSRIREFFLGRMKDLLDSSTRLHPLGFFYAIEELDENVTLRYHLWPKDWSVPRDQVGGEIHDHIFELNSIILAGTLRHQTFDFLPSGQGEHEIVRVAYTQDGSQLARSGERGELKVVSDETYHPGTVYRVPAGTIHRADASETPAATLVLAVKNNNNNDTPRVLIEYDHSMPAKFIRAKLQASDLAAARAVLAQI
jgi:hypothetical protein